MSHLLLIDEKGILQYEVGKKATNALSKLYGTKYVVGSGADTLCKLLNVFSGNITNTIRFPL